MSDFTFLTELTCRVRWPSYSLTSCLLSKMGPWKLSVKWAVFLSRCLSPWISYLLPCSKASQNSVGRKQLPCHLWLCRSGMWVELRGSGLSLLHVVRVGIQSELFVWMELHGTVSWGVLGLSPVTALCPRPLILQGLSLHMASLLQENVDFST